MNSSPHIPLSQYPLSPDLEMRLRIILGRGIFERSSFKLFMQHTPTRDIAVDVGAHVGSWTLGMSKLFNKVIGFEPSPNNRMYFEKNIGRAGATNIVVRPEAVSSQIEQEFYITASNVTRNSGQAHLVQRADMQKGATAINCVKLDSILNMIPSTSRISAVKVDVEGLELDVIKSGTALLQAHKPTVLLEINGLSKRYGITSEAVFDQMADMGYRPISKHHNDYVFRPRDI